MQRNTCGLSICNRDRHPLPDASKNDDDDNESYIPSETDNARNAKSSESESDYDSNDDNTPNTNDFLVTNDENPAPDQPDHGT